MVSSSSDKDCLGCSTRQPSIALPSEYEIRSSGVSRQIRRLAPLPIHSKVLRLCLAGRLFAVLQFYDFLIRRRSGLHTPESSSLDRASRLPLLPDNVRPPSWSSSGFNSIDRWWSSGSLTVTSRGRRPSSIWRGRASRRGAGPPRKSGASSTAAYAGRGCWPRRYPASTRGPG